MAICGIATGTLSGFDRSQELPTVFGKSPNRNSRAACAAREIKHLVDRESPPTGPRMRRSAQPRPPGQLPPWRRKY